MATPIKMRLSNIFKGFAFCVLLFLSSFLGTVFSFSSFVPLLLVKPEAYRSYCDQIIAGWMLFVCALLEEMIGVKLVVSGDVIKYNEASLIVMNHRTRLDWMFFWLCLRNGHLPSEKIVLKDALKGVPGGGWAMQCAHFIFLRRKWEVDKVILSDTLSYFTRLNYRPKILLFPEGTDYSAESMARSRRFAEKNGLPHYSYVIHPRTTGFSFLVQHMKSGNILDAVYDVSVGYPINVPHSELDVLLGDFPQEIHFHIQKHSINELGESQEDIGTWCQQLWANKEEQLKVFYNWKYFSTNHHVSNTLLLNRAVISFWMVLISFWLSLLYFSAVARIFFFVYLIVYVGAHYGCGGMERLEIRLHGWVIQQKLDAKNRISRFIKKS